MVGASVLFKPMFKFVKKFNEKHIHDAPLKGMGPKVTYSVDLFIEYFKKLAERDVNEAGWKPLEVKAFLYMDKAVSEQI